MDFVNFNLAKKLKEKRFREECFARYYCGDKSHSERNHYHPKPESFFNCYNNDEELGRFYIDAPTISQVLKWLRREKDIFIGLEYINQEACGCTIIIQKTGGLIANWNWDKFKYANKNPLTGNTYEQAALAGIEYVLDNLI